MTKTRPAHTVMSTNTTPTPDQHPPPRDVRGTHENSSSSLRSELHGAQHMVEVVLHSSSPHLSSLAPLSTVRALLGEVQHPSSSRIAVTGSIMSTASDEKMCFIFKTFKVFLEKKCVFVLSDKRQTNVDFKSMYHVENSFIWKHATSRKIIERILAVF